MKYLTVIAFAALLGSCTSNYETKHIKQKHYKLDLPNTSAVITEYTIDGCQYLGHLGGDARSNYLTHKGNCNNPIHNQK